VVTALDGARLRVSQGTDAGAGATVCIALRPEKVRITTERPTDTAENCVGGRVVDIGYLGDVSTYKVRLADGTVIKATVANATRLIERTIGWDDEVWLSWTSGAGVVLTG
jgi:putrescine transport system ATP-binding protein